MMFDNDGGMKWKEKGEGFVLFYSVLLCCLRVLLSLTCPDATIKL
jgi:hypothetical protein